MNSKKPLLLILLFPFFTISNGFSQNWVYFSLSQNTYIGDLNPATGSFYSPSSFKGQLGYTLGFERAFDESVRWNFDITIGEYEGAYSLNSKVDRIIFSQNLAVKANQYIFGSFKQVQLGFNWTFYNSSWLDIYTGLGLGFLDFSVKDLNGRNLREVEDSRAENETYSNLVTTLPLKLGFIFFPNSNVNLIYEISWQFSNTDYLDNIGQYGTPGSDAIFRNLIQVRYKLN